MYSCCGILKHRRRSGIQIAAVIPAMANPTAIPTPTLAPELSGGLDSASAQAVEEEFDIAVPAVAVADAASVVVIVWPAELVTVVD